MSEFVMYPRLPFAAAVARIESIRQTFEVGGVPALTRLAEFEHPRASPASTGGHIANGTVIKSVRDGVVHDLADWLDRKSIPRRLVADFDRTLGASLHRHLKIMPADAAHDETWNFLGLVVFPDICVLRFPDMHNDRMLGSDRNSLRRCWYRHEVLGDSIMFSERPLGEDELVGLFERTALARNRELLRSLALHVLRYTGRGGRSDWARQLFVGVTYATGPRLLDVLGVEELDQLIRQCDPLEAG